MNYTKIEWSQNPDGSPGYTWNPITGCLNHVNGLCKGGGFPCYAYRLANGRLRGIYRGNTIIAPVVPSTLAEAGKVRLDPFYPRFWPERLKELSPDVIAGREKGIFVCDMSDLFGIGIPEDWTKKILNYIKAWPEHRFYLLTKQPQNLTKFSPFPDNCWVGVTATNNTSLDKAMLGLAEIVASKRYISFEPLLLPVNFSEEDAELLDWVIIGAQTRPMVYPKIEWVQEIVEAADKAGIPVFLKDNLLELVANTNHPTEFAFNKEGYYRQEMPGEGKRRSHEQRKR